MKISKLIESYEIPELEPLEAILRALTEPMTWSKLYDETIKIKPMHKLTFSKTLKRAHDQGHITIEHPDKRTQIISRNYKITKEVFVIKIKYKAILNEISEFNSVLSEVAQSRSKKKFLKNESFFQALIRHIEKTMYYQKEILFEMQTFYFMTELENDLLKKYTKSIDEMHVRTFKLLKKIDMKYFHLIYTTLQDRLYQESPEKIPIVYEKDLIEYSKLIGYDEKKPKNP